MDVKYQEDETVTFDVELHRLVKIEDWFKDESTIVRTLRKGNGRSPFIDSTIKCRLQVIQNDKEILSNYPQKDVANEDQAYDYFESENLKKWTPIKRRNTWKKFKIRCSRCAWIPTLCPLL